MIKDKLKVRESLYIFGNEGDDGDYPKKNKKKKDIKG
jgi:hypothetical protein